MSFLEDQAKRIKDRRSWSGDHHSRLQDKRKPAEAGSFTLIDGPTYCAEPVSSL